MRLALPLALVLGLGAASCGEDRAERGRDDRPLVGIHASLRYAEDRALDDQAREVGAIGVSRIREDLSWDEIEREPGQFDWERSDRLFEAAARAGLTVLPILNGTPSWVPTDGTTVSSDPEPFARFAAAAVERYGPNGTFWTTSPELAKYAPVWFEIYNEPYLPTEDGAVPDPGRYAALVATAIPRARAANPRARFLLAGETYMTPDYAEYSPWMSALYEAEPELGEYFDGVAAHPYGSGPPQVYDRARRDRSQTRRVEELDAILAENGDGEKPIWITEIGWSTCPSGHECVGEEEQAEYLRQTFDLLEERWSFVEAVFVYHLNDYEPRADDDKEPWFGLRRPDGTEKPAFEVFLEEVRAAR